MRDINPRPRAANHGVDTSARLRTLLERTRQGNEASAAELMPLLYEQMRRIARSMMRAERPGATLQTTALVHEAYLRLVGNGRPWENDAHFVAAASEAMRRILVDQFRRRATQKRGGDRVRVQGEFEIIIEPPPVDVLALDEALARLEADDPRKGQIVNMRFFVGLTMPEIAASLGVSLGTVEREWRYIRTWLQREIGDNGPSAP